MSLRNQEGGKYLEFDDAELVAAILESFKVKF